MVTGSPNRSTSLTRAVAATLGTTAGLTVLLTLLSEKLQWSGQAYVAGSYMVIAASLVVFFWLLPDDD